MGSDAAAAAIEARARDRTAIAVRGEAPATRVVRAAGTARHGPCRATADVICKNGVHLDHARRREAWAEDRAIEPEDPDVDDVDSRAGVGTDDGVKPRALESGTTRRGTVD